MKQLTLPPELFHISFNAKLEGMWEPMIPAGTDVNAKKTNFSEPDYPRISLSPSIEQCFWAIYSNVSKFFEKENYPYMEFNVYVPLLDEKVKIKTNAEIVAEHLVHDAHVTEEMFILSPVRMKRHSIIRIRNCTKNKEIWYHPFNDVKSKKHFLSHEIEYFVVKVF